MLVEDTLRYILLTLRNQLRQKLTDIGKESCLPLAMHQHHVTQVFVADLTALVRIDFQRRQSELLEDEGPDLCRNPLDSAGFG
jgi:hypothetical protein